MTSFDCAWLTFVALMGVMLVRNEIVYRVRRTRIAEIAQANERDIGHPDFIEVMEARYAELDSPSYEAMLFDLRCWTYRHFYPRAVA